MPVNAATQNDDAPAKFTVHVATGDGSQFIAATDGVKFVAHLVADGSQFTAVMDGLELEDKDGNLFTAAVDGMEPEGSGSTALQAQDALIRAMRGWLERQDTSDALANSLGMADLAEEAEVILQFVDQTEADRRRTDAVTRRPPPPDRSYDVEWGQGVSVFTLRG